MGRNKKYPDAENTISAFYAAVSDSYRHPTSEEVGVENGRKSINLLAEEFGISRLKVRKILITTGNVTYPATHTIQELLASGKSKAEICRQLKMAIATLNSFLPYDKGVYNLSDVSNAAENCRIYSQARAIRRNHPEYSVVYSFLLHTALDLHESRSVVESNASWVAYQNFYRSNAIGISSRVCRCR